MKTAVQFGAGNIGRGFMGQLLWEAGFRTVFVDADRRLVELLNAHGAYTLRLLDAYSQREVELRIDRFEALGHELLEFDQLDVGDHPQVEQAIAGAELIGTAVGVKNLPLIAPVMATGIRSRCERGGPPVDVWMCENLLGAAGILQKPLSCLGERERRIRGDRRGANGTLAGCQIQQGGPTAGGVRCPSRASV